MPAATCDPAGFAAPLLDPALACPAGLRAWNGSDPAVRLAIHRNNVVSSLVDALADNFPVVQQLVGVEFFRAMAAVFVRKFPPRSRVLAYYGADFPAFIEQFTPAGPVPYLADTARLEMARVRAYHAADADPASNGTLATALADSERVGELRLVCHPSLSVIESDHAVVSLWAAHQGYGDLASLDPCARECAMVVRPGLDVLVVRLAPGACEFLRQLLQARSLQEAAARAAFANADFDLRGTLGMLLGHGALTSIHLPRRFDA